MSCRRPSLERWFLVSVTSTPPAHLRRLGGTPRLVDYVRDVWRRRQFAWSVAQGEIRAQHLDTALGNLWHLLNPGLQITVYYIVFGLILGTRDGVDNFITFLAIGVFVFGYLQKAILSGGRTLVSNQGLIRSLQFPRALLPLAATLRETMALGSAVVIMLGVTLVTGEPVTPAWALVVPALLLAAIFATGMSFIAARLADRFRDLLNVLPFLFRLAFYLSGVLYLPSAYISDQRILDLLVLNPFFTYITLVREYLMVSQAHDNMAAYWTSAVAWAVMAALIGLVVFRGGEKEYGRG